MKMKGALLALTEAVRLARLELACYQDHDCRATPEWTLKRLTQLLGDKEVDAAMAMIDPDAESPTLVPQHPEHEGALRCVALPRAVARTGPFRPL